MFVSITEQQTGPLDMKGSEWSQSKTGPAGHREPTDSGSLGLGPRTHRHGEGAFTHRRQKVSSK